MKLVCHQSTKLYVVSSLVNSIVYSWINVERIMHRNRKQTLGWALDQMCVVAAAKDLLIPLYYDNHGLVYGIDRGNYIEVFNR